MVCASDGAPVSSVVTFGNDVLTLMQQTIQMTKAIAKMHKIVDIISREVNNNDGITAVEMVDSSDEYAVGSSDGKIKGVSDATPLRNVDGVILGKLEDTPVSLTLCALNG
jgi:hypothetical protein